MAPERSCSVGYGWTKAAGENRPYCCRVPASLPDVASDVATYLAGAGLGLTLGSNLFAVAESNSNAPNTTPAVYCVASGGPAPAPYLCSKGSFHRLGVNVRVLGGKEAPQAGAQLARQVADKLQCATISGYVAVYLKDAQPVFAGLDDHDAPLWSLNAEAQFAS